MGIFSFVFGTGHNGQDSPETVTVNLGALGQTVQRTAELSAAADKYLLAVTTGDTAMREAAKAEIDALSNK